MNKVSGEVYLQLNPANIDMLTKLIEAYDNLAIVSTLDQAQGLVAIRGTRDTLPEIINVLNHLPFEVRWLSD